MFGSQMGGGGMFSPQMLQALLAAQQGQGQGTGSPMSPGAGSPLGMMLPAQQRMAGGVVPPNMAGVGAQPQQQGVGQALQGLAQQIGAFNQSPQQPQGAGPAASQQNGLPGGMGWLGGSISNLLNGYTFGGIPHAGAMGQLQQQAQNAIASGALGGGGPGGVGYM